MRDNQARARTGILRPFAAPVTTDPRIRVDAAHLRGLESAATSLQFLPRVRAGSVLSGRHASHLRGRGLDFEELRDYLPGDDIRSIDWKVTARTGTPHVRVYTEERDRPTLLLVDQRMSMFFGSTLNMKSVTAAETAALTAFAILHQGDRVGGVVFGDDSIAEFKPVASRRGVDAFVAALARANAALGPENIIDNPISVNQPLEAAARIAGNNALVIMISDFDGIDEKTRTLIGGIAQHNDVILGLVTDPMARAIGDDIDLVISDGTLQAPLNTQSAKVLRSVTQASAERLAGILEFERRLGVPVLPLDAGEATLPQLRRLLGVNTSRP